MNDSLVIVGAGHAAGQLVTSLKQHKYAGRIALIGDEPQLPYQRPPLSKKYLSGEMDAERLLFKSASFYDDDQIETRLNTHVETINLEQGLVNTNAGESIAYDTLVLATGSRARRLNLDGENLPGVFYLRSIQDVDAIRERLGTSQRIAIVGAGYIGLEVAAVCRQSGRDVTVIEVTDRVMSRVVSPDVSAFYQRVHEEAGVVFHLSTGVTRILGDTHARAVVTDKDEEIDADLVIIGAGIVPNIELAKSAGVVVDDGIVVDAYCQTSSPEVYAVGDCTTHPNPIYQRQVRLESVHNALEQAKTAASNICGKPQEYGQVPWFWSDQYDLKLQIVGLSQGYDEVVIRGNPDDRRFSCLYLRDGVFIAIDAVNSPRDFIQSKALIAAGARIDPITLADTAIDFKSMM
ncbi:MAG: FAD/NAD(P)-binding oxidoreductase [Pseudomonadota bacterium]